MPVMLRLVDLLVHASCQRVCQLCLRHHPPAGEPGPEPRPHPGRPLGGSTARRLGTRPDYSVRQEAVDWLAHHVARSHLPGVNRGAGCFGFNGRMVVIFGFGPGSPEDQGEVAPCVCPNCHNQVFLHHVRSKKSVRLYFVPVVPYGTDNYLVCPVCSRGLQVSDTQLRHVRSMSSATASFRAGRLSQARYMAQAERFWRQLGVNPAGQQLATPASPGAPVPVPPATSVRSAAPAPPPPPAADVDVDVDDRVSWISQLHQLAQLHNQGVLSDAAYAAAKRRILEQDKQP